MSNEFHKSLTDKSNNEKEKENKEKEKENKEKNQDSENLKFDNVFKELEFFKKKCEIMEKDLFKSQTLNKKNESIIKKLQDMNALYGKVNKLTYFL